MRFRNLVVAAFNISVSAVLLAGCSASGASSVADLPAVRARDAIPNHRTFKYTGKQQRFTVPSGVNLITVVALGASASKEPGCGAKGRGGRVYAQIPVTPGEKLYVFVGGESGYNGGGTVSYGVPGGGASDIREGGKGLTNRIVVAGGGGAAGISNSEHRIACGGGGGGNVGGTGETESYSYSDYAGGGGAGGDQSGGGSGGAGGIGSSYPGSPGDPGALGTGGSGGNGGCYYQGFCSCGYSNGCSGGGGGGGYYGGGGGGGGGAAYAGIYGAPGGGGGGGSSYAAPSASGVQFWQNWKTANGNGLVVFGWQ